MRRFSAASLGILLALAATAARAEPPQDPVNYGIGRTPTDAEIAAWNIDVRADGQGLPPGHGSVAEGEALFAERCQSCHLDGGTKALAPGLDILVGRTGTLKGRAPGKTIGTYWPFATTLFDFIRRAMPFNAPQSLSNDEVYAASAYVFYLNHLVPADAVLDAQTLPAIPMPGRALFKATAGSTDPGRH